ncbi:MAG: hypothetical protein ABIR55_21640 [Burkholderiaceae bacterium]
MSDIIQPPDCRDHHRHWCPHYDIAQPGRDSTEVLRREDPMNQSRMTGIAVAVLTSSSLTIGHAAVFGSLGNFDTVNDTCKPAYGFEIDGLKAKSETESEWYELQIGGFNANELTAPVRTISGRVAVGRSMHSSLAPDGAACRQVGSKEQRAIRDSSSPITSRATAVS